jgi:hypothetical protein
MLEMITHNVPNTVIGRVSAILEKRSLESPVSRKWICAKRSAAVARRGAESWLKLASDAH